MAKLRSKILENFLYREILPQGLDLFIIDKMKLFKSTGKFTGFFLKGN
jgi:hypothetical protein